MYRDAAVVVLGRVLVDSWIITAHVCRVCLGRVLRATGGAVYRCADCGATASRQEALCACGMLLREKSGGKKNAGLRCVANPAPGAESTAEVVVKFMGISDERVKGGLPLPARQVVMPGTLDFFLVER